MFIDWVANNTAILISLLAIIATIRGNVIAHKAKALAVKVNEQQQDLIVYKQRTELLGEIDKQQAILNRLATITLQKMASGQHAGDSKNYSRLENNVNAINHLRSSYEKQRELTHSIEKDASINANERNLADIRRLTLHLEQDIINELGEIEG